MQYEGSVYRPPSEAYSLIIQATVGCSHNKCTFCSMYKDKSFHIRRFEDIEKDLREMRSYYRRVERIFLADGDALCLSNNKLVKILSLIRDLFPECERVGIYGSAKDVLRKTPSELSELKEHGTGIIYLGAESGSPEVLRRIRKSAGRDEIIEAVRAVEEADIRSSVTFISGMGGKDLWHEHAEMSGSMISAMKPSYASLLTLMLDPSAPIYDEIQNGSFKLLSASEVLEETELLISNIQLDKKCVFRSNHASNYLSLRGDLPSDKEKLLAQINEAKNDPRLLRPEYFRAL